MLDLSENSLGPGVCAVLAASAPRLAALHLGQQETLAVGEDAGELAALASLQRLEVLVVNAGHYSASHMLVGLRSPAEAAHLERVRAALGGRVRVANSQAQWERRVGRLPSLFEVHLRR